MTMQSPENGNLESETGVSVSSLKQLFQRTDDDVVRSARQSRGQSPVPLMKAQHEEVMTPTTTTSTISSLSGPLHSRGVTPSSSSIPPSKAQAPTSRSSPRRPPCFPRVSEGSTETPPPEQVYVNDRSTPASLQMPQLCNFEDDGSSVPSSAPPLRSDEMAMMQRQVAIYKERFKAAQTAHREERQQWQVAIMELQRVKRDHDQLLLDQVQQRDITKVTQEEWEIAQQQLRSIQHLLNLGLSPQENGNDSNLIAMVESLVQENRTLRDAHTWTQNRTAKRAETIGTWDSQKPLQKLLDSLLYKDQHRLDLDQLSNASSRSLATRKRRLDKTQTKLKECHNELQSSDPDTAEQQLIQQVLLALQESFQNELDTWITWEEQLAEYQHAIQDKDRRIVSLSSQLETTEATKVQHLKDEEEEQIQQLQATIDTLEDKVQRHADQHLTVQKLESQLAQQRQQTTTAEEQVVSMQMELDVAQTEASSTAHLAQSLKRELAVIQERLVPQPVDSDSTPLQVLVQEFDKVRAQRDKLHQQLSSARSESEQVHATHQSEKLEWDEERSNLVSKQNVLESKLLALQEELTACQRPQNDQSEHSKLVEEKMILQETIETLQQRLVSDQTEISALTEQVVEAEQQIAQLRQSMAEQNHRIETLQLERTNLTHELQNRDKATSNQRDEAMTELQRNIKDLAQSKAQLEESLQSQIAKESEMMASLNQTIDGLQVQLEDKTHAEATAKQQLEDLETSLSNQVDAASSERLSLQAQVRDLQTALSTQKEENLALLEDAKEDVATRQLAVDDAQAKVVLLEKEKVQLEESLQCQITKLTASWNETIEELRVQLKDKIHSETMARQQVDDMTTQLSSKVDTANLESARLQALLQDVQIALSIQEEESSTLIENAREEIIALQLAVDDSKVKAAVLEKDKAEALDSVAVEKERNKETILLLKTAQDEVTKLKSQHEGMKTAHVTHCESTYSEIARLGRFIEGQQFQISQLEEDKNDLELEMKQTVGEAHAQVDELRSSNNEIQRKLDDLEQQNTELEHRLATSHDSLEQLTRLQASMDDLQEQYSAVIESKEQLQATRSAERSEADSVKSELETTIAVMRDDLANASSRVEAALALKSDLEGRLEEKNSRLSELENENEEVLIEKSLELSKLQQATAILQSTRKELEEKNQRLVSENRDLKKALDEQTAQSDIAFEEEAPGLDEDVTPTKGNSTLVKRADDVTNDTQTRLFALKRMASQRKKKLQEKIMEQKRNLDWVVRVQSNDDNHVQNPNEADDEQSTSTDTAKNTSSTLKDGSWDEEPGITASQIRETLREQPVSHQADILSDVMKSKKADKGWKRLGLFVKPSRETRSDMETVRLMDEVAELKSELVQLRCQYRDERYKNRKRFQELESENEAVMMKNMELAKKCIDLS